MPKMRQFTVIADVSARLSLAVDAVSPENAEEIARSSWANDILSSDIDLEIIDIINAET